MVNFEQMPGVEDFKDEVYENAVASFPVDSWVYINTTKQLSTVEEVRPSPDGPRLKLHGIGSIPVDELRAATDEEISQIMTPEEFALYLASK